MPLQLKKPQEYVKISDYHLMCLYSHSQGPVSVGAAEHGWLPVWSIERCLTFELHVPEQAPQIPHPPSHAPSTEIDIIGHLKTSVNKLLSVLTHIHRVPYL